MTKLLSRVTLLISLIVLIVVQIGCGSSLTFTQLKGQDLQKMLDSKESMVLVDIREAPDYASGHIPGAINIPFTEFNDKYTELKPDAKIVLVCYSGETSKSAAQFLLGKNYKDVSSLDGGMMNWSGEVTK